jgi:hypothetical protein
MLGSLSEFRQMAHYDNNNNNNDVVAVRERESGENNNNEPNDDEETAHCNQPPQPAPPPRNNVEKENVPHTYRICANIPGPHGHGVPLFDFEPRRAAAGSCLADTTTHLLLLVFTKSVKERTM